MIVFVCVCAFSHSSSLLCGYYFERKKDGVYVYFFERKKDVLARVAARHFSVRMCDYVNGCTVLGSCRGAVGREK
jgi:hypothetical protein